MICVEWDAHQGAPGAPQSDNNTGAHAGNWSSVQLPHYVVLGTVFKVIHCFDRPKGFCDRHKSAPISTKDAPISTKDAPDQHKTCFDQHKSCFDCHASSSFYGAASLGVATCRPIDVLTYDIRKIIYIHVYLEAGCAHLRPGAVWRMSPGRRSADEPWAQFDRWALGAILPMSPVIFATIGHSYYSRLVVVIIRGSFPWWPVWDCTQASYLQERCTTLWYMLCLYSMSVATSNMKLIGAFLIKL